MHWQVEMSKKVPSLLLYDSIHDFKRAAVLVESEISRQNIRYDSNDDVQGMNGRKHHDMWVSMKAVSHFKSGDGVGDHAQAAAPPQR